LCRIAGIINPSLPVEAIEPLVKEMCNTLKHGGPDDEGFYADPENHLVFGHRRLALIDLSPGGHQPMSYADNRYWITYNGELYNYPELKEELTAAGYVFRTSSDTEVILAAFAAWNTNAFNRFNGMFALAILDRGTSIIYLARDASGIKPLYYGITPGGLSFASETRAFSGLSWLQEAEKDWPVFLLAYGHLPEPVTKLKNVKPLQKGCFLRYELTTREWDIECFTFYNHIEQVKDREEARAEIKRLLQASVKRHLLSDAPIGVFLSGGLDSSIMTVLAGRFHSSSLKTLSIVFDEEKYSERKYQDLVIEQLNCQNWQESLTEKTFHENFPVILDAMDLPGCDGINAWCISKYAMESVLKAVLSGLGGDELFGGYPSFRRMDKVNLIRRLHSRILRAGRFSGSKQLRRLAYLSLDGPAGLYLFLRGQFIPADIAKQLDASEKEIWSILESKPLLYEIGRLSDFNQASWMEMNLYMQNQLLRDSDVMSMAHGIEIRVPFLDKEFVRYALSISSDLKSAGMQSKQLLIESFIDDLPRPVWDRPKMGFTFPFAEWLSKSELAKETMMQNGAKGESGYRKFINKQMHWSQFMSLLLLNNKKLI